MTASPAFRSLAFTAGDRFDYGDVILIAKPPSTSDDPREWAETLFSLEAIPVVVRALFGVRMALAPLLGLRPAPSGVFDVREVSGQEALMVFDDDHLEFRCAVGVDAAAVPQASGPRSLFDETDERVQLVSLRGGARHAAAVEHDVPVEAVADEEDQIQRRVVARMRSDGIRPPFADLTQRVGRTGMAAVGKTRHGEDRTVKRRP